MVLTGTPEQSIGRTDDLACCGQKGQRGAGVHGVPRQEPALRAVMSRAQMTRHSRSPIGLRESTAQLAAELRKRLNPAKPVSQPAGLANPWVTCSAPSRAAPSGSSSMAGDELSCSGEAGRGCLVGGDSESGAAWRPYRDAATGTAIVSDMSSASCVCARCRARTPAVGAGDASSSVARTGYVLISSSSAGARADVTTANVSSSEIDGMTAGPTRRA